MRSFEQYILEAKQNYIFGGTDNRNTKDPVKKLCELEEGDAVYWFSDIFSSLEVMTFDHGEKWPNEYELVCAYKGGDGKTHYKTLFLEDDKLKYAVSVGNHDVVGTDAELFLAAVNKNFKKYKYTEDDIFDSRVNEAHQNYIFGGTDNRNTDVDTRKTFGELEKGDVIFYASDNGIYAVSFVELKYDEAKKESIIYYDFGISNDNSEYTFIVLKDIRNKFGGAVVSHEDGIVSTSIDDIIDAANGCFRKKWTKDDIDDLTDNHALRSLKEAKQNYIFGGTDDRNTDIGTDAKKFNELDSGDIVYYVSVSEFGNKVVEAKVIYHNAKWMKFKTPKRKVLWDWDPGDYETKSIVYNDYSGKLFALSTSKELIKELLEQYINK